MERRGGKKRRGGREMAAYTMQSRSMVFKRFVPEECSISNPFEYLLLKSKSLKVGHDLDRSDSDAVLHAGALLYSAHGLRRILAVLIGDKREKYENISSAYRR